VLLQPTHDPIPKSLKRRHVSAALAAGALQSLLLPGKAAAQSTNRAVTATPLARPAPGTAAPIGFPAKRHPQGLPATLTELDPVNFKAWNPGPGSGPWAGSGTRGGKGWHTANDYGGVTWVQSQRLAVHAAAGGHVAFCPGAPYAYDVAAQAARWLAQPIPHDGLSRCPGAITTPEAIAALYPPEQFNTAWGEWLGGFEGIAPALRQPGRVAPLNAHTYMVDFWVPGQAAGNRDGVVVHASGCTGNLENTGVAASHLFDLDTGRWRRAANHRSDRFGGSAGAAIYHPGVQRGLYVTATSSKPRDTVDVYEPARERFVSVSTRNPTVALVDGCGLGAFLPNAEMTATARSSAFAEGLLLNFVPVNAAGVPTYDRAVAQRIDAVSARALIDGTGAWSTLKVEATSWPMLAADVCGDISSGPTTAAIGWCFCPPLACFFAVNGQQRSTTLWKLEPPPGARNIAELLGGRWLLSTETLTGPGLLARRTASTVPGTRFVYNRLVWDDVARCLIWFPENFNDGPTALTPRGL
jgi:hypothetical protein